MRPPPPAPPTERTAIAVAQGVQQSCKEGAALSSDPSGANPVVSAREVGGRL